LTLCEENVVIAAGDCSVTVMPALGGKIASLCVRTNELTHELLHAPLSPYAKRNRTMAFSEGDAGGWDECLPSVAGCSVATNAWSAVIPDHGDLWRVPWQVLETTPGSNIMRARCFSLPLEVTRSMILFETSSGWRMQLLYSLTNLGGYPVPWSWAAHPLFACGRGDLIHLPDSVHSLRSEFSRGNRLGSRGDMIAWPSPKLADGQRDDLSKVRADNSGIAEKLFAGPMHEGWCALERPSIGLCMIVRFDPTLIPYLGLWICYGGWPEGDGPKQVCIAPEPSTAPVDSLAETGVWSRWLDAGKTVDWAMELQLERIEIQALTGADAD
jgi:galactose mutarotase-like enzyme